MKIEANDKVAKAREIRAALDAWNYGNAYRLFKPYWAAELDSIPINLHGGLIRYILIGQPVGDFLDALRTRESAARARDLDAFAGTLLARYRRAKDARALLDFDDLVTRAGDLLTRSDMAAWALYRLDQGIDHILVDEAQDTSPGQWAVIRAIAHEFNTGAGARAVNRTLFVVGDEKQSIYSFQGAELRAFGENRRHFGDWLDGMGGSLARPGLVTSFRSAPGLLSYVDAVFAGRQARSGMADLLTGLKDYVETGKQANPTRAEEPAAA